MLDGARDRKGIILRNAKLLVKPFCKASFVKNTLGDLTGEEVSNYYA